MPGLVWILLPLLPSLCEQVGVPLYDPVSKYQTQVLEGWQLRIHAEVFRDQHREARKQMFKELSNQLYRITRAVPEPALSKLRAVPIWIEVAHPQHPCMCYHVSRRWLRDHGMNPAKARGVELSNVRNFVQWTREQPWMVLHELAHAYHHRELGFDNTKLRMQYQKAVASGKYSLVEHIRGRREPAYALTNTQEYFAECSEALFGTNDFYPFVRSELQTHDPEMAALLAQLWGVQR